MSEREFRVYKAFSEHGRPFEHVAELEAADAKSALAEYHVWTVTDPESIAKFEPTLMFDGVTLEDPEHRFQYIVVDYAIIAMIEAAVEQDDEAQAIYPGDMVHWLDDYPWQVWGYSEQPGEELHVVLMNERGQEFIAKYCEVKLIEPTEVVFRCDPDALGTGKMKEYAIQTAEEMAEEHDAVFDGTADYFEE